jgi:hypothetical protein
MTAPAPDEVSVPVVGTVRKRYVIIGGGVAAAIVVYAWWKHRQNAASASTVDTSLGGVGPDATYVNPVPGAVGNGGVVDNAGGTAVLDNQTWVQAVLADFQSQGAIYDPLFAAETLGKYLAGQPLTTDEATLVRTAWGMEGHPPQGDLPIVMATTASTPGGSTTPTPSPPPNGSKGAKYVNTAKFTEHNPPWNSTLGGIAHHYGETVDKLMQLNIGNPDVVSRDIIRYPGRVRYQ